ncbi:uncharacterized protein KQ657_004480 [Scheffersomyces spartinae]|uniref:Cytochrome b5 heme-binding domain-containing protein n=1 Tax=Scheffersomyces spartinae TaxID=45513 RepID=A0A9P7VCH7_9ASCO|nr:uncharacterized protein KQ657_004480 [Scheffersomyces spartinae]KAG7194799.1 hypothetical protein KQ657_004480 [Scheffersomyces spartinae]
MVSNPIVVVGGGLAGLSASHQIYQRGGNVILIDKQGFLSGNSGKATSGINGALTREQVALGIVTDSEDKFLQDTLKSGKGGADVNLAKILTYDSRDAINWLTELFGLDLSVISRLGGHSEPRTHRGNDAKFPGMAITYRLLETLEALSAEEPDRVQILKNCQVIDLIRENGDGKVKGVKYKDTKTKEKFEIGNAGAVILCTGGYAADFTPNSLLKKFRSDLLGLPTTNGVHATGDGIKIVLKNKGSCIDLDKVQVHPTGLIDLLDKDAIAGTKLPPYMFLGAEALRGEGGIIINNQGERFVDELGTRDHVSGEIKKQLEKGNGPIRLILNAPFAEEKLPFHVKHYTLKNLMKKCKFQDVVAELANKSKINTTIKHYNSFVSDESKRPDEFGKRFFASRIEESGEVYVSFIHHVLHFTMGGIKIDIHGRVLQGDGSSPIEGLYAAGEVAGGVHGHNRLGGSSLLACVVFGRLTGSEASKYQFENYNKSIGRLQMLKVHLDPNRKQFRVEFADDEDNDGSFSTNMSSKQSNKKQDTLEPKKGSKPYTQFKLPETEFTEEEVAKHNREDDCWCIIKNVVIDLTSFLDEHPGGKKSILQYAGKDATELFEMFHQDNFIELYVRENVLGRVKGKSPYLEFK